MDQSQLNFSTNMINPSKDKRKPIKPISKPPAEIQVKDNFFESGIPHFGN